MPVHLCAFRLVRHQAGRQAGRSWDCWEAERHSGFPVRQSVLQSRGVRAGCKASRSKCDEHFPCLTAVAINLIVQHIQDILNGDLCKRHRGGPNGRNYKRTFPEPGDHPGVLATGKRSHLESSSRPH